MPKTKIIVLQGPTHSGKTKIYDLLCNMIGENNFSNVSWQDLEHDGFEKADLDGKYMNLYDELDEAELKKISKTKMLTNNQTIIRIRPPYGHKFFPIRTKFHFFFTCNHFPPLPNYSEEVLNRLLPIRMEEQFTGANENLTLGDELSTEAEKSRIFNSLLPAMRETVKRGRMAYELDNAAIVKIWEQHSSSSAAYAESCIEYAAEGRATLNEVWEDYQLYCNETGLTLNTKHTLNQKIRDRKFKVFTSKMHGKSVKMWQNLKIKPRQKPEPSQKTL